MEVSRPRAHALQAAGGLGRAGSGTVGDLLRAVLQRLRNRRRSARELQPSTAAHGFRRVVPGARLLGPDLQSGEVGKDDAGHMLRRAWRVLRPRAAAAYAL